MSDDVDDLKYDIDIYERTGNGGMKRVERWRAAVAEIERLRAENERLNETIEYLEHFKQNADFGPAEDSLRRHIQRGFIAEFRRLPPDGWDFDANGERMTEDDLVEILQGKVSDADKARG